jgi:hypothetical protein
MALQSVTRPVANFRELLHVREEGIMGQQVSLEVWTVRDSLHIRQPGERPERTSQNIEQAIQ